MRMLLGCLLVLLCAGSAVAQPAPSRFSLIAGAGAVGSTSSVLPGSVTMVSIGADPRLSPNWELRVEAGRRFPSHRSWEPHSLYYEPSPDDPSQAIESDTTQLATEDTLVDVAMLLRRAWPIGDRFEAAFLTGLDFSVVNLHSHLTLRPRPGSGRPEEVFEHSSRRTLRVLDIGVEGGVRLSRQWRVLAFGIAGLQPPIDEDRRPQLRSGLMLKRVF